MINSLAKCLLSFPDGQAATKLEHALCQLEETGQALIFLASRWWTRSSSEEKSQA